LPDIEKDQHRQAGPAIGRFLGRQFALDAGFAAAGDHRGRKPVALTAAWRAQVGVCAVISSRVAFIGNASANVSSMPTPLRITLPDL